jgi:uncharacterized protein
MPLVPNSRTTRPWGAGQIISALPQLESGLSPAIAVREMEEPRWLVDEMLGRLARYLRFLGYDAEYARGASDADIVKRARTENRRIVTRDRGLARRLDGSVLLARTDIAGQLQEFKRAFPGLRGEVRFDRCSLCNGRLRLFEEEPHLPCQRSPRGRDELPAGIRYACSDCGHLYWEGSHTASIRARLAKWLAAETLTA